MFDNEFYDESISKNTKLLIVNNSETESYFSNFLSKYLSKNKRRIIGFDIEFNTPPGSHNERVIAIFQIAFYFKKYVLVIFFNPLLVNKNTNKLITKFKQGNFYSEKNKCDIFFRSGLELKFIKHLEKNPKVKKYKAESLQIEYFFNGGNHNYIPDILIEYTDG